MPETQWSLIARAENGDTMVRRQALTDILRRYSGAMKAHLALKRGLRPEQSDDLLQGFVADKVLEQMILTAADQARGRFRNFLLTALDHYAASQFRHGQAGKRNPGVTVPLEAIQNTLEAGHAPPDDFDVAWVRQLLQSALDQMQAQCHEMQRPEVWEIFRDRLVLPLFENLPCPSYEELVTRFGFATPTQASNVLITGKRMFARILRCLIAEYEMPNAVEEELADLYRILERGSAGIREIRRI